MSNNLRRPKNSLRKTLAMEGGGGEYSGGDYGGYSGGDYGYSSVEGYDYTPPEQDYTPPEQEYTWTLPDDYYDNSSGLDTGAGELQTTYTTPQYTGAEDASTGWGGYSNFSTSNEGGGGGNTPVNEGDSTWQEWAKMYGPEVAGLLVNYYNQKKSSSALAAQTKPIEDIANMQVDLYNKGGFLRDLTYANLEGVLGGSVNPSTLPQYRAIREPLERQYAVARSGIEGNVRGEGALAKDFTNLEASRASEVGGIPGRIYEDYFNKALAIANPALANAILSSAAATRQPGLNIATNMYNQSNQQLTQSGMALGSKIYESYLLGDTGNSDGSSSWVSDVNISHTDLSQGG